MLVALLTLAPFVASTGGATAVTTTAALALVGCLSFTLLLVVAGLGARYDCELDRRPFAFVAFLWVAALVSAALV